MVDEMPQMPFPPLMGAVDISHDTADFRVIEHSNRTIVQIFPRDPGKANLLRLIEAVKQILTTRFRGVRGKAEMLDQEKEIAVSVCITFTNRDLREEDLPYLKTEFPRLIAACLG